MILSRASRIRLLFGLHSVTSLAYEILWMKMLEPRLGMSTAALGTVLAVFILGLGVGSAFIGQRSRRAAFSPRQAVVLAEAGLAIWALLFPFLLRAADVLYSHWAPSTESAGHHALRVAVAMILLLPATSFIGMIFPVLASAAREDAQGSSVGRLYRDGLVGSTVGCVVVPALLIHLGGLSGANAILALLNAGAAAFAYACLSDIAARSDAPSIAVRALTAFPRLPLYVASLLLGASLFIAEVVGGHFVWLHVTNSFYSNGILVGTVLVYMGLGSWFYDSLSRRSFSLTHAASLALLAFTITVLLWMAWPFQVAQIYHAAAIGPGAPLGRFFFSTALLVSLILAGPAFAAGFVYPALCDLALAARTGSVTSDIGRLTAWNYAGSMIGSLAATFYLIPTTGLTWTLACAALGTAIAAAVLVSAATERVLSKFFMLIGAGILVVSTILIGRSTTLTYPDQQGQNDHQIIFHHEDATGLVEIFEDLYSGDHSLYSNRLRMEGSNAPSEDVYKAYQGALPVLLHPSPTRVLVVGLGTGASLAHNLRPDVQSLTCVEYSSGMVVAAGLFTADNERVLSDPRVRLVLQDGRNFIKLSHERYDVIIQDLFFPYQTGVGNLYTVEHFNAIRAHLAPHGRFGQWIPLHEIGPKELASLIHTFHSVFPSMTLWLDDRFLLLYGGDEPLRVSWPSLNDRLSGVGALPETSPADFLNFYVGDEKTAGPASATAPLNTDNNLFIETRAPLLFSRLDDPRTGFQNMLRVAEWSASVQSIIDGLPSGDAALLTRATQARALFYQGLRQELDGRYAPALETFQASYKLNPMNYQNRSFLEGLWIERAEEAFELKDWAAAKRGVAHALAMIPKSRSARYLSAEIAFEQGAHEESVRQFDLVLADYPDDFQARLALGDRLAAMKKDPAASMQYLYVAEKVSRSVEARFKLANALLRMGKAREAVGLYEEVLKMEPHHPGATALLPVAEQAVNSPSPALRAPSP